MEAHSWPIIGQQPAVRFFEHLLNYEQRLPGKIGGSYILAGNSSSGKMTTLEYFLDKLAKISNTKPAVNDIARLEVFDDKREIGVSQARDFSNQIALSSFGGYYRIGIISSAEQLSIEAANALLKTLEDAREQVIIFLLTTSPDLLPPTVVSRSQIICFNSVSSDTIYEWLVSSHKTARTQARHVSRLASGRPGVALNLVQDKKIFEEHIAPVRVFCTALTTSLYERWQLVDKLLGNTKGTEAVAKVHKIITSWRLGLRDILLLHLHRPELVVHSLLEEELNLATKRLTPSDVRNLDGILNRALKYLQSNISPKLVLEQVMMNIQ